MLSESGRVSMSSLAGTVVVTDGHRRIEAIADYLKSITESVVRQIDLEVEIYEVTFSNEFQLGVNWNLVVSELDSIFNTIPDRVGTIPNVAPIPSGGGLIVRSPVFGTEPSPTGFQYQLESGDLQMVVEALEEQGDVTVVSKPRLRTLNNQPAVVRVGTDIPVFLRQVTQGAGDGQQIFSSETIQTITVGTVLSLTPQVSRKGVITLEVTPAVSRLVEMATSASGFTTAPVVDVRQASSIVRLRDGETVIMGGLVQDGESTTVRKIPLLGNIPYLGKLFSAEHTLKQKSELIFFLTPRIVHDVDE
jgi:MSHA type pilus biogenesis protein MshL